MIAGGTATSRFLFEELRAYFPLYEQLWVRTLVDRHVAIAREVIGRLPGPKRQCGATTRAGDPCRRQPLPGSEFCPSHRRLYESMGAGAAPERASR